MNKFFIICAVFYFVSYTECLDPVTVNFRYKSSASLDCSSANFPKGTSEFYRVTKDVENEDVKEKVEPKLDENDKPKISIDGDVLTLHDLRRPDISADYFCQSESSEEKLTFNKNIEPFLMHPDKLSKTVTEGGFAEFFCEILYGNENETPLEWRWTRNGTDIEASDDIVIEQDQTSTKLTINPVSEEHKGFISCEVKNEFGTHNAEFQLRVKNTLAALWPFLGICAEVLILCVIILIYEKKCNKKSSPGAEDNEQAENLMGKDTHGDLKKRNTKA